MLTYTDSFNDFLRKSGNVNNSADTTIIDFFKTNMNMRYQMCLAELASFKNEGLKTAVTVAAQQYYHYPTGIVDINSATVTIGNIPYPIQTVNSLLRWQYVNESLISTSAVPAFIFPRRDDFGIWPIPQGVYAITFGAHLRDRNLGVADYTTGTVSVTLNSQTVTGLNTVWTTAMIGRWFCLNDASAQGQGYWYRISDVASNTSLTLETSYEQTTVSGKTYKIGEVFEIPEEAHVLPGIGAVSDWFAAKGDVTKATWWNNVFYVGDGNNSKREGRFTGGLLGMQQRYANREKGVIVHRGASFRPADNDKRWSTTIS